MLRVVSLLKFMKMNVLFYIRYNAQLQVVSTIITYTVILVENVKRTW